MTSQLDNPSVDRQRGHLCEQFGCNGIGSAQGMYSKCANEPALSRFRPKHRVSNEFAVPSHRAHFIHFQRLPQLHPVLVYVEGIARLLCVFT